MRRWQWRVAVGLISLSLVSPALWADEPLAVSTNASIREALSRPAAIDFTETPIEEVVEQLSREWHIPIVLDKRSLSAGSVGSQTLITRQVKGVSGRKVLERLLHEQGLTCMLDDGMLEITTTETAQSVFVRKVYDVSDLVVAEPPQPGKLAPAGIEGLVNIVSSCCAPTTWGEAGGSIERFEAVGIQAIVVVQNQQAHEQVEEILAMLRAARHGPALVEFFSKPIDAAAISEGRHRSNPPEKNGPATPSTEASIREALARPAVIDFTETPLSVVMEQLAKQWHISVVLDRLSLSAAGVDTQTPITRRIKGVSGRAALRLLLRELDLAYMIDDGVLTITTPETAQLSLVHKVYDVSDLVAVEASDPGKQPDFSQLIDVIEGSCGTSGSYVPGVVKSYDAAGIRAIVVVHNEQVHEQVEEILAMLRAARHGPAPVEFFAAPIDAAAVEERLHSTGPEPATK